MSKFLNIFAPAAGGAAGVFALAYVAADQFVVDIPAPIREMTEIAAANAQAEEAAEPAVAEPAAGGDLVVAWAEPAAPGRDGGFGLGREAHPEEVAAWDIDVRPDGLGLPVGSGDVMTGEEVFVENCAVCHGDFAEGVGRWPVLAGGWDTLTDEDPVLTIGSYWPYLSTVFDYVHRAMPYGNAQSLEPDQVYAITAYLLSMNNLVDDDFVLSNENFADFVLPNQDGFIMDDRIETEFPEFTQEPCMSDCKEAVEIVARATDVDVTPEDAGVVTADMLALVEEDAAEAPAEEAVAEAPAEEAVVEEAAEEAAGEAEVQTAALDPALVEQGARVFRACQACHQVGEGAVNRTGPHLNDVFGRVMGSVDGFRYSNRIAQMGAEGMVWNEETLAAFITNPRAYVQGTKMSYAGLRNEAEMAPLLAYLQSFSQ